MYTAAWRKTHASWIGVDQTNIRCGPGEPFYFPVCVGGYILQDRGGLNNVSCSKIQCFSADKYLYPDSNTACLASQPDTQEYIPPAPPVTRAVNNEVCAVPESAQETILEEPMLGMDQGIPPYYTPFRIVRLNFTGTVRGQGARGECGQVLEGAKVDIWQIDPTKLAKFSNRTSWANRDALGRVFHVDYENNPDFDFSTTFRGANKEAPQTKAPLQLRDISCRGFVETDEAGHYKFQTTMPPSHGPPRYIMMQVSAPGYATLTTRVYFEQDQRLQQLTTLAGVEESQTLASAAINHGLTIDSVSGAHTPREGQDFTGTRNDTTFSGQQMPGIIASDPRVISLVFKEQPMPDIGNYVKGKVLGHFDAIYDVVLKSKRPNLDTGKGAVMPAMDIDGLWADENGGLIKVETEGNMFHAAQYPHSRSWGTVMGTLSGDTIRGVDFTSAQSSATLMKKSFTTMSDETSQSTMPENLLNNYESSGVVLQDSSTSESPKTATHVTELSIQWSSAQYGNFRWQKQYDRESKGYRYVKLVITRETTPSYVPDRPDGTLVINEIQFYQNILGQHEAPAVDMKMTSPRQPDYQQVTCSSFIDQMRHCFRAFDGDASSSSAWQTKPVGSSNLPGPNGRGLVLAKPQWVMFDFGPGYHIQPSAMRIVCGAADDQGLPRGCPRTFQLLGSKDNMHWETITKVDMYDYAGEYANGGQLFRFFWEAPTGRPNGHRCGTCEMGPKFMCNLDAYDGSCASRYCNTIGSCDDLPLCPAGEYMDTRITSANKPTMECRQCAPGRYGSTEGLTSSFCSGICREGYYCQAGATTATQFPCGGEHVYCPRGSGAPVPAAAGRHTVFELVPHAVEGSIASGEIDMFAAPPSIDEALNAAIKMGEMNYLSAPLHVYNATITTNATHPTYRQYGWVDLGGNQLRPMLRTYEVLCQRGHYCHKGIQLPCPVGVYGDREGLQESRCTEPCIAGEYCPEGSVTPTICEPGYYCPDGNERVKCPPGSFGRISGLKDKRCSGLCKQGFYCNSGSTSPMQDICPAGRYGQFGGHGDSTCSGLCQSGYYCPAGSTNDTAVPCGNIGVYCPVGSPLPVLADRGYYTTGGQEDLRSSQTLTEKGFYTMNGRRESCPAGTYGAQTGMVKADKLDFNRNDTFYGSFCSGLCDKGHYCPLNSTVPTQIPCPPGRYGSFLGQVDEKCEAVCPLGHFCVSGSVLPVKCPAGLFGNTTGLGSAACSTECWEAGCKLNQCQEGYYCPEGSSWATQHECGGPDLYCPTGSAAPTKVTDGWYTIGPFPYEDAMKRVSQQICPVGYYCVKGSKVKCPPGTYGNSRGLSDPSCTGPCGIGFYCPIGSFNATSHRCPAGRYGSTIGLLNSACSGPCAPGYHCPEASISPTEFECGVRTPANRTDSDFFQRLGTDTGYVSAFTAANLIEIDTSGAMIAPNSDMIITQLKKPNLVFCPEGTGNPLIALPGYYTIGNSRTTRFAQQPCSPGTYCINGVVYDCPAGRFGITSRLASPECSGPCAVGHYCPSASTSRDEHPCPIGRYGATEGLGDSMCSGPCKRALDCPLGSTRQYPATNKIDSNIY